MSTYSFNVVGGAGDGSNELQFVGTGTADNFGVSLDNVILEAGIGGGVGTNDTLDGGNGSDTLYGNGGDDKLSGGNENDFIYGGEGNDKIEAGNANDYAEGNEGNDTINGGNGNDTLDGGLGADKLNAGNGQNVFVYTSLADSTASSTDVIYDWSAIDTIDLSGLGFTGISNAVASGTTLGYSFIGGNTVITADGSDFSITLEGVHGLNNGDFIFA